MKFYCILVLSCLSCFSVFSQQVDTVTPNQEQDDSWINLDWFEPDMVTLTVEVPFVELHSGPGIGYPVLHVVEKNESLIVLLKRTEWLKVQDKRGNTGWLYQDSLFNLSNQGQRVAQQEFSFSDYQNRSWEAGVSYGDLEGANLFNVHIGYVFNELLSSELSVGKALGNVSDSDLFEISIISQPFPNWVVTPYIGVGAGIIDTKPHSVLAEAESRENTLMSTAFGVKYHLARNFIVRAEYKYSLVLTDRDDNEEIQASKLGFSVFF